MAPPAQCGWVRGSLRGDLANLQLWLGPMLLSVARGHGFLQTFKVVHILKLCFSYAITLLQAVNVPNAAVSTLEFFF